MIPNSLFFKLMVVVMVVVVVGVLSEHNTTYLLCTYSVTSLNRPTMGPTLSGPFTEMVGTQIKPSYRGVADLQGWSVREDLLYLLVNPPQHQICELSSSQRFTLNRWHACLCLYICFCKYNVFSESILLSVPLHWFSCGFVLTVPCYNTIISNRGISSLIFI